MVAQDFAKFVASQQNVDDDAPIDWTKIREKWLANLDWLHHRVIEFLQKFVTAGSISYSFADVTLTEENLGTYSAKRMEIRIGRQHVRLEPIGTLLIGGKGRVDVIGSAGTAQLLLINEDAKTPHDLIKVTATIIGQGRAFAPPVPSSTKQPISWAWKIVSHQAGWRFVELDEEAFFMLLLAIANA
jgi:hypothetical protein